MSLLSRQCVILNISQSYRPPRSVTGITLLFFLHHEDVWGTRSMDPGFLSLGTSWKWVVSFTPQPLYPEYVIAFGTHWIGRMNPRSGLNVMERRTFLALPSLAWNNITLQHLVPHHLLSNITDALSYMQHHLKISNFLKKFFATCFNLYGSRVIAHDDCRVGRNM
jgi:hypothetical protein